MPLTLRWWFFFLVALSFVSSGFAKTHYAKLRPITKQWYVMVDGQADQLLLPRFTLPISLGTAASAPYPTTPMNGFSIRQWIATPVIHVGYRFNHQLLLPEIFGDRASLEMVIQHNIATGNQTRHFNSSSDGAIFWYINGGASVFQGPGTASGQNIFLHSIRVQSRYENSAFKAIYHGYRLSCSGYYLESPYVGASLYRSFTSYGYRIHYNESATPNTVESSVGDNSLTTYFAGFIFGDRLDVFLTPHFSMFGDVGLTAGVANTQMIGHQIPISAIAALAPNINQYRKDTMPFKWNVEGRLKVGMRYYLDGDIENPDAMTLNVFAGLNYWSYAPQVLNPHEPNVQAKIGASHASMFSAGISLVVPFE